MIFLNKFFFFEKILSIFDIENCLWKYKFGTFWRTIIHRRIVLKKITLSILGQKSCILGPTNSTTELTLIAKYVQTVMPGDSSYIRGVLIGVEDRNCRQTLDIYLPFAIWMGQIQSKLIYVFLTYQLASLYR